MSRKRNAATSIVFVNVWTAGAITKPFLVFALAVVNSKALAGGLVIAPKNMMVVAG
ncbi:MAG: hypothetical protein ACK5PZ_14865 [Pirellula sp.]